MTEHKINVHDDGVTEDSVDLPVDGPPRDTYVVLAESGLFKRGKQYDKGSTIELDARTAAAFLAAGDIEEE